MHAMAQALLMNSALSADPYFANVASLLSFEDLATSFIPLDAIPAVTWTNDLNRMVASSSAALYGNLSMFRGSEGSGGLRTSLLKTSPGTVAFTAEIGVKFTGFPTAIPDQNRFWDISWSGDAHSLTVNSLDGKLYYVDGAYNQWITTQTMVVGPWYQVAIVFDLTSVRIFVDGILVLTRAQIAGFPGSSVPVTYAPGRCERGNGDYYLGYIDECRLTVGVARYTADYLPPSSAFPRF